MVRFLVHPFQRDSTTTVEAEAPVLDERRVRSSSGKRELPPRDPRPTCSGAASAGRSSSP